MKVKLLLTGFLFCAVVAQAQGTFSASLSPVAPTPDNSWFKASAMFSPAGDSVGFNVTFGQEGVVPTTARLIGATSDVTFDLGTAHIAVHSPGPWPDGYDGATFFYGSFSLPDSLRTAFLAGQTILSLTSSYLGDFQGAIVPVPEPSSIGLLGLGLAALGWRYRKRIL